MVLSVLAAAVMFDRPVSWSGSPVWKPSDPASPHVRTVFHKVDITLTWDTATYKAKTLYKNTGDKPVSGQVLVPILGTGTDDTTWFKTDVKGVWGTSPVSSRGNVTDTGHDDKWSHWNGFDVTLKPGEWKAFESTLTRPLPKSGEGLAERFVTYLLQPYDDSLEQVQIAIHYPKGLVFHTITVSPSEGWQVGENGAFWQKKDWRPGKTAFRFMFYPGTFEKIGR